MLTGFLAIVVAALLPGVGGAEQPEEMSGPGMATPETVRLVQSGDAITFHLADLTGPERIVQKIEWRKKMRKRQADYVQLAARFDADGRPGFAILLVEEASVDRLNYLCPESAATCTLRVDSEFQYGGDSDGKMRFLVLHDKDHGQYQSRFVTDELAGNFARGLRRFEEAPQAEPTVADVRKVAQFGMDYLGEYLVDFSASSDPEVHRLVEAGDQISFYPDDLVGMNRVLQVVQWQYRLKKMEATYVQLAARFGDSYVILFVQEPLGQRLLGRCEDSMAQTCTVTVDAEFQYGGDKEGTMRFLVFHNRAYEIFQHRFVNQTMAKNSAVGMQGLRDKADEINAPMFGAELAVEGILKISEMGQAVFGDPLRDF